MKIKPSIYQELTPPQRLIAIFEALGRNDEDEIRQIIQTCPKKTYRALDSHFIDPYDQILDIALLTEYQLLQLTLEFVLSSRGHDEEGGHGYLREMASLDDVWTAYLDEQGISKKNINAILPRHPTVAGLIEDVAPLGPEILATRLAEFKMIRAC